MKKLNECSCVNYISESLSCLKSELAVVLLKEIYEDIEDTDLIANSKAVEQITLIENYIKKVNKIVSEDN